MDDPLDFEALTTQDDTNWDEDDYGALNYDDWELDDNEVKTLMIEWRRNVLDPVLHTYEQRQLPWCSDMPLAQEIYDSSEHDTDEDHKLPEEFDDRKESDISDIDEDAPKKPKEKDKKMKEGKNTIRTRA